MENLKIGDSVKGEVTGITSYGVFVKLENGYDGLIHISEISDKFVNNIEKLYIAGDIIEAKVIEIDDDKKQIKLSVKDFNKKSRKRQPIQEKGKGFEPLKEKLDVWVKEKLEELEKSTKTP
ncbi:MAG: S1 RNA-binding domain-containing protein [Bacilli bacterium]|nr:S1 RNA-binding domain-containing protein [Bacilli bacterium]